VQGFLGVKSNRGFYQYPSPAYAADKRFFWVGFFTARSRVGSRILWLLFAVEHPSRTLERLPCRCWSYRDHGGYLVTAKMCVPILASRIEKRDCGTRLTVSSRCLFALLAITVPTAEGKIIVGVASTADPRRNVL
jgi:hypothetical protein